MGIREMKGARILVDVCGAVRPNERVVIVTDTNKVAVAEHVAAACWEKDAEPVMIVMLPRTAHGEEPPASVAKALLEADVVFAVTTFSLYHSTARGEACRAGARWVNMPDFYMDMLAEGGLYVDFAAQRSVVDRVAEWLTRGSGVKILTDKGTDIEFSIEGRAGYSAPGICDRPGMVGSPPNIEANVAPVEGTARGKVVVDGSIVLPGIGVLQNDVVMRVENGFVVSIEDTNREAEDFKRQLDAAGDPKVYNIGEFGVGLNPRSRLTGRMLDDEGVYGTIHFGLGDNHTIGGNTRCAMHTDVVIKNPTILIDGKLVMDHGKLLP